MILENFSIISDRFTNRDPALILQALLIAPLTPRCGSRSTDAKDVQSCQPIWSRSIQSRRTFLHSDPLRWKRKMVLWKSTFLYEQGVCHFHVSESEYRFFWYVPCTFFRRPLVPGHSLVHGSLWRSLQHRWLQGGHQEAWTNCQVLLEKSKWLSASKSLRLFMSLNG